MTQLVKKCSERAKQNDHYNTAERYTYTNKNFHSTC